MINVTKTYLPPIDEYIEKINKIWRNEQITNNGSLVKELEHELKSYLGVKHLFLVSNGTLGLQIALKSLNIKKKIITTPFSYVATINSVLWENAIPVFADIESSNYCIDPNKVESLVDEDTEAILAVHVYGYPCNIKSFEEIARKYKLKIIYDAAHAFGSELNGKSLCGFGDISVLSFHATKLFHTIEGGALITDDSKLAERISLYRSFGHIGDDYISIGINAKMSEMHAAMGLCILPRISEILSTRKKIFFQYNEVLSGLPIQYPEYINTSFNYNYAYYPVMFLSQEKMLTAKRLLEGKGIYPRRYFYPSLNKLPYINALKCPVAEDIAARILCLPLSHAISLDEQKCIATLIKKASEL